MSEYRTGDDPINKEQEMSMENNETKQDYVEPESTVESVEASETTTESEEQSAQPEEQQSTQQQPSPLEDIETAVLLVVNSKGSVLPVVQIENLNMRRIATPREVYRICLDAADQLSSVSLLGEMTGIYSTIAKEQGKLIAQNMAQLLIQAQQSKASNNEQ